MDKRVRIIKVLSLLLWLPLGVIAQSEHLMSSARSVDTGKVRVDSERMTGSKDVSTLPLFGEQPKTGEQIEWEIRFLNECDQTFNNRAEASQFFSTRGWDYLTEGQLDTAVNRFNRAWLLNDKNSDSYWGLGVISYQQGKLPQSIRLLRKGLEVADTNAVLMTDLATVQLKYYKESPDQALLDEAVFWLNRSLEHDSTDANTYIRLSWANYVQGQYAPAWEYLHKARLTDLSSIDPAYLKELLAKAPDPQGVFR